MGDAKPEGANGSGEEDWGDDWEGEDKDDQAWEHDWAGIEPEEAEYRPVPTKVRWGKSILAVLLAMVAGLLLRIIVALPVSFLFGIEERFPPDVSMILEAFAAFFAGALAGSFTLKHGWLFGSLTQVFKVAVLVVLGALWLYVVAIDEAADLYLFAPLRSELVRMAIVSIACATVAGVVAQKYREQILGFLAGTLGFVGSGLGCVFYALGGIAWLYFMYLGGKEVFEGGSIIWGLLLAFVIGPAVCAVGSWVLIGLGLGLGWVVTKIYDWYAPDLGLVPLHS